MKSPTINIQKFMSFTNVLSWIMFFLLITVFPNFQAFVNDIWEFAIDFWPSYIFLKFFFVNLLVLPGFLKFFKWIFPIPFSNFPRSLKRILWQLPHVMLNTKKCPMTTVCYLVSLTHLKQRHVEHEAARHFLQRFRSRYPMWLTHSGIRLFGQFLNSNVVHSEKSWSL